MDIAPGSPEYRAEYSLHRHTWATGFGSYVLVMNLNFGYFSKSFRQDLLELEEKKNPTRESMFFSI